MTKYPTYWEMGKPSGSIRYSVSSFLVIITHNGKQKTKMFSFNNNNKDDAYRKALQWQRNESNKLNLTKNKIRYLNKDTIEVQVTNNINFIADAKYLDKVQSHLIIAKAKKTKTKTTYYIMCRKFSCKTLFPFTHFIYNDNPIEYIDGNTLNLKSSNIMIKDYTINLSSTKSEKQYLYFTYVNQGHFWKLPENIWILGKPSGTIFKRKNNAIVCNITGKDGHKYSKSFSIKKYGKIKAMNMAKKWQIITSYNLGQTKQMIRIKGKHIETMYIEIKITNKQIIKTDIEMIKIIQQIPLLILNQNKLHKFIMGNNITHINDNIYDNRLINLIPRNNKKLQIIYDINKFMPTISTITKEDIYFKYLYIQLKRLNKN